MLKFREAPLVVESLACLEKAVPSPSEVGGTENGKKTPPTLFVREELKATTMTTAGTKTSQIFMI